MDSYSQIDIHQDKNGKWWIWSDYLEANIAIRAETKEKAVMEAIDSLLHYCYMYKESRDALRVNSEILREAFEKVFGDEP